MAEQKPPREERPKKAERPTGAAASPEAARAADAAAPHEEPWQRQATKADMSTALSAEAEPCAGSLHVVVFEQPETLQGQTTDQPAGFATGQTKYNPEERRPLAGVRVTVTGPGFSDTVPTDAHGEADWPDLAEGTYDVTVVVPSGYAQTQEHKGIKIERARTTYLEVHLMPKGATLRLRAFLDANRSGVWYGQPPINHVMVDLFQRDTHLACVETASEGYADWQISRPGLVTIAPSSPIRVDGRLLRTAQPAQIIVQVEAGQFCEVAIPYALSPAELQLSACLDRIVNGEHEMVPFSGVTFSLYEGLAVSGIPIRQATTRGTQPVLFTDLGDGDYTIVPAEPATHRGRIKLAQPRNAALRINLCSGQTIRLREEFCYQLCTGRVVGRVLDSEGGDGLAGVPVLLLHVNGHEETERTVTSPSGEYIFEDIAPGNYIVSLEQSQLMMPDGTLWTVPSPREAEFSLTVSGTRMTPGPVFRLMPDIHRIWGYVFGPDQKALPNIEIAIRDARGTPMVTVVADEQGHYEWIAPIAGTYYVAPLRTPDGSLSQSFPVSVNQPVQQDIVLLLPFGGAPTTFATPRSLSGAATSSSEQNGELREALVDLSSYPILTEETGTGAIPRPAGPGAPGAAPLGQVVENALRDVLAWRPKANDPKGFLAALSQSFTCENTEGRTICQWTPRSYAVQADMGAITGAQASIYTRAKAALDQSLPLLEGLYPLRADADPQDAEAERAIVRSQWIELVNELGIQGGPRVPRVDSLFDSLLGLNDVIPPDIEKLQGQLSEMRDVFGFERNRVNTVEEEQNLTNFIILVDHTKSLRQSWIEQRPFFNRSNTVQPFFGTQLVLVSRALAVVAESVQEAIFAMDSVFLDSAEQQTVELLFPAEPPSFPNLEQTLFVGELLDWAERFALEEAPRLIQDGGKSGVISFLPVLDKLRGLVRRALLRSSGGQQDPARLPAGYRTARVQRALQELADHLDDAFELARQIRRNGAGQARAAIR